MSSSSYVYLIGHIGTSPRLLGIHSGEDSQAAFNQRFAARRDAIDRGYSRVGFYWSCPPGVECCPGK